jgi:hypothetical protein
MSRRARLLLLFWIAPALVGALGLHLVSVRMNPDLTFIEKLGSQVLVWEAWWGWSMVILAVCDRVPFGRGSVVKPILVHVPLCAAVMLGQILVVAAVSDLYGMQPPGRGLESIIVVGIRSYGDMFLVIYWAIVGAHAAFRWHEAWRVEATMAAQLSSDLANAQLSALRSQLNPHFLFNSLNSIVTLIGKDPAAAERMVVRLAELLRVTLAVSAEQYVSLRRELDFVRHYLDIEQIRFNDRLTIDWHIDDDTLDAEIPALALQPLVENAIQHGVGRMPGPGRIMVGAQIEDATLELTVRDNGPGPSAPRPRRGAGIGVTNLRERLERLYGGGGCLAALTIPHRPHQAPEAEREALTAPGRLARQLAKEGAST